MAPIDRAERDARRQQRVRGAGTSSAVTGFNFSFDFAPAAAKHSSVPPQRTQRTPTPKQQTPRTGSPSAHRHRSASVRRSNSGRRHATPGAFATPQLGKRKRGSTHARVLDDHGEPDELSPEQNNETHSIEQPARVVGTVSPTREDVDEEPDELTEAPPETPSVLASTPHVELEEEEDELTPAPASVTPRVVGKQPIVPPVARPDEVDELSSPPNSGTTPTPVVPQEQLRLSPGRQPAQTTVPVRAKRGRPKRTVVDEADEVHSTPAATKHRRKKTGLNAHHSANTEDSADELSPEVDRARKSGVKRRQNVQPVHGQEQPVEISSAGENSEQDQALEQDEPDVSVLPAPREKPVKRIDTKQARKRPKFSGPKQAISVMRIKGSTVRGITVADTTRTVFEENIDHQVQRMADKMQTAGDSSRRKKLRGHINLALAFKESLVEKLMDLQDANDTLSAGFKKRKLLRKDNLERRREILQIQNSQHEIALEMDDERAVYDAEKAKAETKTKLNANMFEIQAAIQSGRERARREGREDEGPERPLHMLIDEVGRQVGSVGGGLLASLQHFNEGLERAAGWLEGRA